MSMVSILIPLLIFTFSYNKTFNKPLKVLFIYLVCSFTVDLLSLFVRYEHSNFFLLNSFTYLEFVFILYIFYLEWNTRKFFLRAIIVLLFYTAFFVISTISIGTLNRANNFATALEPLILVFLSIYYFFNLLNRLDLPKLNEYYFFWINTAFLIFFSVAFFVYIFAEQITTHTSSDIVRKLWYLQNVFHIIYNCILSVGISKWKTIRT